MRDAIMCKIMKNITSHLFLNMTLLFLVVLFFFRPLVSLAAPSVSETSGTVLHGGTITIEGNDFGAKNPAAPVLWDDGEQAAVDNPAAVRISGGGKYIDASPRNLSYARQSATDSDYDEMQYRLANFRGVTAPHGRSEKFLAGSHNSFRKLAGPTYRWTRSAGGVNEYFCELAGGGNPGWGVNAASVGYFMIGNQTMATRGARGSLANNQWDYGDNDSLGYSTWYFRSDAGDPDVSGAILWGGTNDLTGNQVGANVMLMACVPPQGGVANCSQAQSWTNLFVHYYTRYDPSWPTFAYSANEKIINFEEGDTIYNPPDYYSHGPYVSTTPGQIGVNHRSDQPGAHDPCNPPTYTQCFAAPKTDWQNWEWQVSKATDSTMRFYVNNQLHLTETDDHVVRSVNKTGVSVGGYYCLRATGLANCLDNNQKTGHPDAFRYFDDVYIDNTYARVVLANNASYEQATIVEPQIPSAWSDGSIAVTVNGGKFADGQTAFLFVFDAENNHNASGYPVTIGFTAEPDVTAPAVPMGLIIR